MIKRISRMLALRELRRANESNEALYRYLHSGQPFEASAWRSDKYPTYMIFMEGTPHLTKEEVQANREFGFYVWYLAEKRAEEQEAQVHENYVKRKIENLEKELESLKKMVDR